MSVNFERKLGVFRGRNHLLFWEGRPDMDTLEEFIVNVSYSEFKRGGPERIQIVRIDNVGKPLPTDQLWRTDKPKKVLNWRGNRWELFSKAVEELRGNWRRYARRWERNRGYR